MYYISKGIALPGFTEDRVVVQHFGQELELEYTESELWLRGQHGVACTEELWAIDQLYRMGLLEYARDDTMAERYEMLTHCVLCLTQRADTSLLLTPDDAYVLAWLKKAGLHLSLAELVCLAERGLEPSPELTGEGNRQALVEAIYTQSNYLDNILDNQMQHAQSRDRMVTAVLGLVKREKLVLL